jgi:hypothetical protein
MRGLCRVSVERVGPQETDGPTSDGLFALPRDAIGLCALVCTPEREVAPAITVGTPNLRRPASGRHSLFYCARVTASASGGLGPIFDGVNARDLKRHPAGVFTYTSS